MGDDEAALMRLWREKRGEVEPEDLPGKKLIVQLGLATEELNRRWFEANTGNVISNVQLRVRHPAVRWMGATLDGKVAATGAVFEAKFILPWSFSEEAAAEKYMAQLQQSGSNAWAEFFGMRVAGYFFLGRRRFRSRRPSPPPFSSMNSIPARSKAARIASTAPTETSRRSFSKSTTVESPRPAACASCD
jgi:hypothetical protein